ncbi:MAG: ATP synthase F1 subunit epsilon [Bdellovibrionales bacterium GWA2_49_15]|nr:MAG: ATP synthase F1 subunit epsilon [Bdellovibrionales bacterium GWA2_49_15]
MNYFLVDVLTPNRVLCRNMPAETLFVPTIRGEINILPEHTHIIAKLDTGMLSVMGAEDDPDRHFSITTGICKVLGKKITILSNVSEEQHEIDQARAERALVFAQQKLDTMTLTPDEFLKYRRKVERANLRIQIAKEFAAAGNKH